MTQSKPQKKIKVNQEPQISIPKTIIVNLINNRTQPLGTYQLTTDARPQQLQDLLLTLLPPEEHFSYNFFHKNKQIKNSLAIFFQQISYSDFQANFDVVCHPSSNFRVRPVTRAASSMYGHTQAVLCLQFSPDCQNLASGSGDGSLRLWDISIQTPLKQVKASNWVQALQWSPDSQRIVYAQKNGNITVYNPENENEISLNGHTKFVTSLAWQPLHLNKECSKLISASKDATIRLWNSFTGVCERSFGTHTKCVTKVVWSGSNQIISCSEDQRICCFDMKGNILRQLKRHSHWVNSMSLSTQHVLKRGCFEPGKIFEAGQNKQKKALQLYKKATEHHGQRLVTGSDDFTLMLFDLPNKVPKKLMVGHGKPVVHVLFSPDGRYIASGSYDKKIKLWDGYSGEFMCNFDGHVAAVYVMSWSVDSQFLISASQDSTLKLWDLKTRKLMMDLPGHADQIFALDWSTDGRLVASGGKDRQVKLWMH